MELPETPFSRLVDPLLDRIGNAASWIWVVLLVVIVCNVVLRYALAEGRIEFEEIQWHLYSVGFMLGLGYALQHDAHVRVDVLHERFRPTTRAWIDLYGIILFLRAVHRADARLRGPVRRRQFRHGRGLEFARRPALPLGRSSPSW